MRPSSTTAATAYTASTTTEITRIIICNTTASAAAASVFHDDDGATYSEATALAFGTSIPANGILEISFDLSGGGIIVSPGGTIGVKTGTSSALTFSVYGIKK